MGILKLSSAPNIVVQTLHIRSDLAPFTLTVADTITCTTELSAWLRDTADNRRRNSVEQSAYIVSPAAEHF